MTASALDLLHFSAAPLVSVHDVSQELHRLDKPTGLWVSVGDSWLEWCRAENYYTQDPKYVTRVELRPDARVLLVPGTFERLLEFTRAYELTDPRFPSVLRYHSIDWKKVAQGYDGIIIEPYCWEARHEVSWYYSWDCASGCIWNSRAVAGLFPVEAELAERTA